VETLKSKKKVPVPTNFFGKSKSVNWHTPLIVLEKVRAVMSIDLDPCSNRGNHTKAKRTFTRKDDALSKQWKGNVFMNPPYGKGMRDWIHKLISEHQAGRVPQAIALVPARTNARWFQELAKAADAVCFPQGGLRFINGKTHKEAKPAMFPSALFYLGPDPQQFQDVFSDLGCILSGSDKQASYAIASLKFNGEAA